MEYLHLFFIIMIGHWVGDFVLQSDWMARNKSRDWMALTLHVGIYSIVMTLTFGIATVALGLVVPFFLYSLATFQVVTFVTHWVTDYFSSKATHLLRERGDYHNMFVVIGLDQLIHYYTLILTMLWLV
jgi:hypothetical protein